MDSSGQNSIIHRSFFDSRLCFRIRFFPPHESTIGKEAVFAESMQRIKREKISASLRTAVYAFTFDSTTIFQQMP